jgi:transposase-like protein
MTKEEKSAQWRSLVEKQAESNLNGAAFCREHRINQDRFYHWRRRFQRQDTANPSSFVQLVPYQKNPSSGIRIHLGEDVSIEVQQGFHPETLRDVMVIVR